MEVMMIQGVPCSFNTRSFGNGIEHARIDDGGELEETIIALNLQRKEPPTSTTIEPVVKYIEQEEEVSIPRGVALRSHLLHAQQQLKREDQISLSGRTRAAGFGQYHNSSNNNTCDEQTNIKRKCSDPSLPTFLYTDTMEANSSRTDTSNDFDRDAKDCSNRRGRTSSSEQEATKTLDSKTLRRLAQNREAARKSRLRKKAYVQQLESSRMKLSQLEQHLQQARAQGFLLGTGLMGDQGQPCAGMSSGAAAFEMEYGRWVEEYRRMTCELGAAYHTHMSDNELRAVVDNCLAHFDDKFRIKHLAGKSDVFHVVSGIWKTPAERCFMWMGGFRPSDLIKILVPQLEPFTDQQLMGIYSLQHSSQQAEEALSQGLENLQQSLTQTIVASSLITAPPDLMSHMALAVDKLSNLEGFVRQADNLRQETLHQLHRILTTRQMARCLLAMGEYFNRLRTLSYLFADRSRHGGIMDGSNPNALAIATAAPPQPSAMALANGSYFSTL